MRCPWGTSGAQTCQRTGRNEITVIVPTADPAARHTPPACSSCTSDTATAAEGARLIKNERKIPDGRGVSVVHPERLSATTAIKKTALHAS
ncbi:hypothetical protein NDU88_007532 [Pleurodeles waltl]|uniref:Uncharacterized protein n=1 Tax=Pleurodeles waltl TaxID=8319 RepID=A0AAV7RUD6_PLEWA|nr:hypothetical protein NDU88_007532 [Pleurodeles waltl]